MRILLVEDDDRIARPILEDLRYQNHSIDHARDGVEAWDYTQTVAYDLILLDWMLPRLDGINLCRRLRSNCYQAYILMITARDTTSDTVTGLDAGADDYLMKPFDLEVLSARIRALARRSIDFKPTLLIHGKLQLDPGCQTVTYAEQAVLLTPREFMILECLMRNPEQLFTRSTLLSKLWELDQLSGEQTVKTHITNLRRKLREAGSPEDLIETVYGVGYRLCQTKKSRV
jgi:two-component system response regulator QseB